MRDLSKSIRTVQGSKRLQNTYFSSPVLQLSALLLSGKLLRTSVIYAGCRMKVYVLASGHPTRCIFPCMWVERERERSPSFLVILMMTLWNISHQGEQPPDPFLHCFLTAFTIFSRVRWVQHSLASSGDSSQLLCTGINWDTRTRWRTDKASTW